VYPAYPLHGKYFPTWRSAKTTTSAIPTPTTRAMSSAAAGAIAIAVNTTITNTNPRPTSAPYPTDPTFESQSMNATDDEKTTILSQETILKIEELKRLIYKYPQCHYNPGAVISCVIYFCNDGDNTLLDEKLEQLRTFDTLRGYSRM
jgi:hypothetical protein